MMRTRKGHKVYPLTVAQKFHLYYLPFCPTAAVLNIGTSLTIEVELDWDLLAKSINKAIVRSEAMRVRLAKDKEGNWYQYVVDPEEQKIEFVDFSGGTMEEADVLYGVTMQEDGVSKLLKLDLEQVDAELVS